MVSSQAPRTGRKISTMPRRGDRPGFKRGRHNLPYWIASQVARDLKGYPDKCIPLPPGASDEEIAELCRQHTARLREWIDGNAGGEREHGARTRYDGTVRSACRIYQEHPHSDFHSVKYNTRSTYTSCLKVIEGSVGGRIIRNVTIIDVKHWYNQWQKPAVTRLEDGTEIVGPPRIKRAHDAVSMFRTVVRFMGALRHADCRQLAEELRLVRFEKAGAREQEMTSAHVGAFIKTALELGNAGVIPRERGLYMALGVAAQFETMLRQRDIIGEWPDNAADIDKAVGKGAACIRHRGEAWVGWFTWENIPGWLWRVRTSKSKYRAAAMHDLSRYGLLFPLLEAVPHAERTGAIVKGEHGLPVRRSSYAKWFRQIARAAGIPDEVWNMDARAGAVTEAEESGADLDAIRAAAGHSKEAMTLRYIRGRSKKIASVAEARARARKQGENGGAS